jgi:pyrroline-5-carboxylate reductase
MRYGFIGYGNMGSIIVRTLLKDGSMGQADVTVYNRTAERLEPLLRSYPGVTATSTPAEAARSSEVLFLCVRSTAVPGVMKGIEGSLAPSAHLITINGGVMLKNLEKMFPGAVSKVIPSMTMEAARGVTLVRHNEKVSEGQKSHLAQLFGRSSLVREVEEDQFEAASDLTSCAPGLMAEMMLKFAEGGARAGQLWKGAALEMVLETMMGTAILLTDLGVDPEELKSRVATRGGITEQGLKVLDRELPGVYDRVFGATLEKHAEVKRIITDDFDRSC